jgi:hypothetical protein
VVPVQQIAFTGSNTHKGSLDFDIAVYDSNDRLLTGLSQIVKTTLTDATYQQQMSAKEPIRFFQQIDLPPGQLFLRVGVLDHTSNKVGTLGASAEGGQEVVAGSAQIPRSALLLYTGSSVHGGMLES